jgi:multidrug efflux pump subunit AcrA (membrane-fusion protein)
MKRRIAPISVALVFALSTVACNQQQTAQEPATPTPIPTPIVATKPTYTVTKGEVVRQIQFTGRIGPVQEADLFFKVAGRVRNVNVKRDEAVKKGQILADLEIEPLERQVAQSQLDLERVQVNLDRQQKNADSAIARAQIELSMKQQDYDRLKTQDLEPQRVQAQAAMDAAKIAVQQAQAAYDAAPPAGRSGSGQAMALQRATLDFQSAKAAYDQTMALITTGHQYDIDMAAKQVALAQNALNDAKQGVDPLLQNDVKRAELSLKTLQAQVSDSEIIAPYDGKVQSLRVSPGSPIDAYVAGIVVADPTAVEVVADVNSTMLTELKEGMPVSITLVSFPDKPLTGKIRLLPYPYGSGGATKTDTSGTTAAAETDTSTRITVDPAELTNAQLQMGDLTRMTVILEKKTDVLWLPPQAVRTFEGRKFVVVQEGSGQRRVDVKVGIQSEDRVEIQEGLKEGQVAVAP